MLLSTKQNLYNLILVMRMSSIFVTKVARVIILTYLTLVPSKVICFIAKLALVRDHIHNLEILLLKENKPKGLKVTKEDQRLIGLMVDRLDG